VYLSIKKRQQQVSHYCWIFVTSNTAVINL